MAFWVILLVGIAIVVAVVLMAVGLTGGRKNEEFLSAENYQEQRNRRGTPSHTRNVPSSAGVGISDEVHAHITSLVHSDQPIKAIKLLREKTSLSLLDAKNLIDAWDTVPAPHTQGETPVGPSAAALQLTNEDVARVSALIARGEKIQAIKEVRLATSLGLKEAKDLVDAWAERGYPPVQ